MQGNDAFASVSLRCFIPRQEEIREVVISVRCHLEIWHFGAILIVKHKLNICISIQKGVFAFLVKVRPQGWYLWVRKKTVSQQVRLCIFQCVASTMHVPFHCL